MDVKSVGKGQGEDRSEKVTVFVPGTRKRITQGKKTKQLPCADDVGRQRRGWKGEKTTGDWVDG